MRVFSQGKGSKSEVSNDSNNMEIGLKVLQTENGLFGVYQMQTGDELLIAETKERAERAKGRLEDLINWNRPEDIYFMILCGETDYKIFQEMNKIIDYYGIETDEGFMGEWFSYTEKSDGVQYIVEDDDDRKYDVTGELIKEGLAIHQEKSGAWTIDHIPTAVMMTSMPNYEKAKSLADHMAKLIRWGEREVVDLFCDVPEFREYLSVLRSAVLRDQPIPKLPQKLSYKLEFFHIQNEKTDFLRFNQAIDRLMDMTGLEVFK
jgi:hypothetical protein